MLTWVKSLVERLRRLIASKDDELCESLTFKNGSTLQFKIKAPEDVDLVVGCDFDGFTDDLNNEIFGNSDVKPFCKTGLDDLNKLMSVILNASKASHDGYPEFLDWALKVIHDEQKETVH